MSIRTTGLIFLVKTDMRHAKDNADRFGADDHFDRSSLAKQT
jgi:hypothetical protein